MFLSFIAMGQTVSHLPNTVLHLIQLRGHREAYVSRAAGFSCAGYGAQPWSDAAFNLGPDTLPQWLILGIFQEGQ